MPSVDLAQASIVVGVSGGIAAYKGVELVRSIRKLGMQVRVIMTSNATRFVGPITFEALSGNPVCLNLFEGSDRASIQHIEWARSADAVVVAPATANVIGKLACGIADDALSTFLLAVSSPVLICPSMNSQMYLNPAVQQNIENLRRFGYRIVEPESGELACGTSGPGRLPEPEDILDELVAVLTSKDFSGKRILISAGPTREHFDPVRFISNPSSGKMGYALAVAAHHRGADVLLVTGPTHLAPPRAVQTIGVNSAAQMAEAVFNHAGQADIVIMTAAVSDYRPEVQADQKMKKGPDDLTLRLVKNPDILRTLGERKSPGQLLIGFAAETEQLRAHATQKLREKNLDMIVGNLVGRTDSGFAADTNQVSLFYPTGNVETMPLMEKQKLAHHLLDRIAGLPTMT
ncbi:bifunctional phosphopantothenoylcysteine decarboxylase/phosphopantothenate--cysteine ligase CoaBC [Desulfatirhabdium butyrativorans]|uniref:bifunctional phosphopantothenoylcysteine decarboxylase/phosphopantothenate--cysteine ligase CoaBC n=1 Tax=Desulfatirhabdium butyrativorans TaxID=340467 RepID=UPI00040F26EE|nr:bifunctional phosphopantothenoylcysteine decarboxylase/phosphopantothenate--cysteine ligase CoaBC [Desulfatirhabdium butyrativorans]